MKRFLFFLLATIGALPLLASAAQPPKRDLMLTWAANTYSPANYAGRVLPTANSKISAYVSLFINGQAQDLSRNNVYWYLNDKFIGGGLGLINISLSAPEKAVGNLDLRVEIPDHPSGEILKSVAIPVVAPEIVLEKDFPGKSFGKRVFEVYAHPYFFNIRTPSELGWEWRLNNNPPTTIGDPTVFQVTLESSVAPSSTVRLSAKAWNPKRFFEGGTKTLNLIFNP